MVYGDHIAITSGDKSTTRREVSAGGAVNVTSKAVAP
jgi:hypothetical protein